MKPILVLAAIAILGCGTKKATPAPAPEAPDPITSEDLLGHIKALSADEMEGRAPGSAGAEKAVAYLRGAFEKIGLETSLQPVPMVQIVTRPSAALEVKGKAIPLAFPNDFVIVSRQDAARVDVDRSELVFVGYGVVAPEHGWDDFKGADVRGKTVVMLVGDPPVPDPKHPERLDEAVFRGATMTYYGRWTYKYESARAHGAVACLIVHETGPAGYPYEVVISSRGRDNFDLAGDAAKDLPLEGWITLDKAQAVFRAAGLDFAAQKQAAARTDFRPVPLAGSASFHLENTRRALSSPNVIARLPGADPARAAEAIVYTAHWDHLGRDPSRPGDGIFNGAQDNASGVAALLEVAEAFRKADPPPPRTILFVAVTGEERGLLGSRYYAAHPVVPLDHTLANVNIDRLNVWGRTRDLTRIGVDRSTLTDLLAEEAARQGREVVGESEPEKGFFYRSDHFELAKLGVPVLYVGVGVHFLGRPDGWGREKLDEYTRRDYHKPSDEVHPDWDLSGGAEDARLLFRVGRRVADASAWPTWAPGSEFAAARERMLAK